jgi:hypothetical protein
MKGAHSFSLLSASAQATLALATLVGATNFATGLAFSQSALQMRVDDVTRRATALLDDHVDGAAPVP